VLLSFGFDEWVGLCASCEFEEMELQGAAVHISRKFKRHVPPEEEKRALLLFSLSPEQSRERDNFSPLLEGMCGMEI
jgi:hypothetical protein